MVVDIVVNLHAETFFCGTHLDWAPFYERTETETEEDFESYANIGDNDMIMMLMTNFLVNGVLI